MEQTRATYGYVLEGWLEMRLARVRHGQPCSGVHIPSLIRWIVTCVSADEMHSHFARGAEDSQLLFVLRCPGTARVCLERKCLTRHAAFPEGFTGSPSPNRRTMTSCSRWCWSRRPPTRSRCRATRGTMWSPCTSTSETYVVLAHELCVPCHARNYRP